MMIIDGEEVDSKEKFYDFNPFSQIKLTSVPIATPK